MQLGFAISGPFFTLLLMLHNQTADFPIALHHGTVDTLAHMVACLFDNRCDGVNQYFRNCSAIAAGYAIHIDLIKLLQKIQIIVKKQAQIIDAVAQHGKAV